MHPDFSYDFIGKMMDEKINSNQLEKKCEIWTVGGAKGGTGKSFISSNMAIHLAQSGKKATLIDMDIGGANLHSFLGIEQPKKSLTLFFEKKTPLEELKVKSGIKNLSFIAGDINSIASDSIRHFQKQKLFRHIEKLESEVVIVDIGPGSHNIFIDTFLIANKKIAVLLPEVLSVENLYHFIKNALFRQLKNTLQPHELKEFVKSVWERKEKHEINNLWELITWLKSNFPFLEGILNEMLSNFKIYFILNKIMNRQDIALGAFIKSGFARFLDLDTYYLGFVEYDENVITAYKKQEPFLKFSSTSSTAEQLRVLVRNLLQGKEQKT